MSSADRRGVIGASANWLQTWPRSYGFALFAVIAATFVRQGMNVALGPFPPFVIFLPAVIVVAVLAGFGPGVFATLLSAAAVAKFFWASLGAFGPSRTREIVGLLCFCGVGTIICGLAQLYRRHESRLLEFERVVEGVEDMIVVVDRDYRYLLANRAFLNYRGSKEKDVIGRRVSEVLNPEVFESTIKPKLDECFSGKIVQYEMRYAYPTCGERDLVVTYFPIQGSRSVDRVASVFQDVTELKKANHSLALFRTLIDHSNDAVEVVDPETLRFLDVNEKACKDLGYTREELLSMTVFDVNPSVDPSMRARVIERVQEAGCAVFETSHWRKDGSSFPVEVSLRCVESDRKYMVAITRDISDRKKAEQEVRDSEDRYRDLVEHSEDLVCTHDLSGRLLSVNPAPARTLGYEVEELLKIPMRELVAPEFREQFDAYLEKIKSHGTDRGLLCVVTRSGERRIWEYNNTLRTEGVAEPIVRGMARDVTERKRAESALRRSELQYRSLFEKNIAGVALSTSEGIVLDCNHAWARMLGYESADEIRGRQTKEFYFEPDEQESVLGELAKDGWFLSRELRLRRKDGSLVWVLFNCLIRAEDGGSPMIQATAIDITNRKQAEAAVRSSEEHFRSLVEQASDGIFLADANGRYVDVNSAGAEMLGYTRDEILQLSIADVVTVDNVARIPDEVGRFVGEGIVRSEWTFRRKDGSTFPGEVSGKQLPDGRLQGILRDMTERKQAEDLLRQSEERFRVALKDTPITVFNQDKDLRYTWIYNPQLYWQHEVLGKTDDEILGPKKASGLNDLKKKVLRTGTAAREEVALPQNGKSHAFDMTVEPVFDVDGNIVGITGACMDIARLREMTDRLQEAKERLTQEKLYLQSEIQTDLGFEEIIGHSPALREVLSKARIVAPTDSTVLLLGETGTGKELVARSVHSLSGRRDNTFVKLNCAAVPSGLLESELFGHEKGAFTGAVTKKIGRIELADKGTLFLDEIGELPLELQPKLLRVLQDREFERLGGVQTLHVDVRIVSATNRDLRQDIADRQFREDLFYRLNVFPIELPPLRERRDDIPVLVQHFVGKHALRMGKRIDNIPDETMQILRSWSWPGNVRELENVLERMVIMTRGRILAAPPAELGDADALAEDNLTEMERDHIIRVLRETNGVISGEDGAASRLGIKRTTLQSMIKRLGIEAHEYRRATGTFGR